MIPLKMLQMQGARFPRNEAYLAYVAVTRKSKQRSRWGIFSGIKDKTEEARTSALKEWSSIEKGFLKLQSVRFRTVLVPARQKPAKR
jgi:hypothetical protein